MSSTPRWNGRFDDDDSLDDFDIAKRRRVYDEPSNTGLIGFFLTLGSLGLFGAMGLLWYLLTLENQAQNNPDRTRLTLYWFMFLDILNFVVAVTGTIMSGRGLSPANPSHRGWSMTGLILGIVEIIVIAVLGFILFCCVGLTELMRNAGG